MPENRLSSTQRQWSSTPRIVNMIDSLHFDSVSDPCSRPVSYTHLSDIGNLIPVKQAHTFEMRYVIWIKFSFPKSITQKSCLSRHIWWSKSVRTPILTDRRCSEFCIGRSDSVYSSLDDNGSCSLARKEAICIWHECSTSSRRRTNSCVCLADTSWCGEMSSCRSYNCCSTVPSTDGCANLV